jgi:hypothetical protein
MAQEMTQDQKEALLAELIRLSQVFRDAVESGSKYVIHPLDRNPTK